MGRREGQESRARSTAANTSRERILCSFARAARASRRVAPFSVIRQNSLNSCWSVTCGLARRHSSVRARQNDGKFAPRLPRRPSTSEIGPLTQFSCILVNSRPTATRRSPSARQRVAERRDDPVRRLEEDNGAALGARAPRTRPAGPRSSAAESPAKTNASVGSPDADQRRQHRARAGNGLHAHAGGNRRGGEAVAGVGDRRRPGVGHQRDARRPRAGAPPARAPSRARCARAGWWWACGCRSASAASPCGACPRRPPGRRSRRTRSARRVMSSRLPMGVATRKSVPEAESDIARQVYCTRVGDTDRLDP